MLPKDVLTPIKLLISTRQKVGISSENCFLFAVPIQNRENSHIMQRYNGYYSIGTVMKIIGLPNPEDIKSTELRKYMATVLQISSLNKSDLESLCRQLGHSVDVHNEYPGLQDSAIELSKVSKLLIAVDSRKGGLLAGTLASVAKAVRRPFVT